ncbi:hypothetical protein B0H10DRAFT_1495 [Mycena sp. CBHHK59/15]|nr:hypothetical protein B0H10DRAFT_1495 [Mycena sp. CBHHK59/15]
MLSNALESIGGGNGEQLRFPLHLQIVSRLSASKISHVKCRQVGRHCRFAKHEAIPCHSLFHYIHASMTSFPNEVWMRVFANIVDAASLKNVMLTSRRFHNLAVEEMLRTIVWNLKMSNKSEGNLEFMEDHEAQRLVPRTLEVYFSQHRAPGFSQLRIVHHVSWFSNLNHLSLFNGAVPSTFYHVLVSLQNLRHLTLDHCHVPYPPPFYPLSFPSFSDAALDNPGIPLTHLDILVTRFYNIYEAMAGPVLFNTTPAPGLLNILPHLRALKTDYMELPVHLLEQLTSLSLYPSGSVAETLSELALFLPHTLNLLHLCVDPPQSQYTREAIPPIVVSLPSLRTFSGPCFIADSILDGAPDVADVAINTVIGKVGEALDIIEKLNPLTMRSIDLMLQEWDDEVLLAITQRLTGCDSVKVTYRYSDPADDFLFHLGIQYLPRIDELHTLQVHSVPDEKPPQNRYGYGYGHDFAEELRLAREEEAKRVIPVPPSDESCFEYLSVWTRYNKQLRSVRFCERRLWVRAFVGGRWSLIAREEVQVGDVSF